MNQHPIYVLSLRNLVPYPAEGCVMELEDVFSATMEAPIVAPSNEFETSEFLRLASIERPDLFVASITLNDSIQMLKRMRGWREIFGKVFVYVFDAFLPEEAAHRSPLRKRFSRTTRITSRIDHIFIPISQAVGTVAEYCDAPVTYVPMAADVERFGSDHECRAIDVNAYGRQNMDHVHALADRYNRRDSGRSLYYTNHMSIAKVNDLVRHRAFFWKMLAMSRIALAYDAYRIDPDGRKFPYPFVGQRWFESLAAGCIVVGFRPQCSDASTLLPWPDSTIECPDEAGAMVELIEKMLGDVDWMRATRRRNYNNMRWRHDWSYRVAAMATAAGIRPPDALAARMARLRHDWVSENDAAGMIPAA